MLTPSSRPFGVSSCICPSGGHLPFEKKNDHFCVDWIRHKISIRYLRLLPGFRQYCVLCDGSPAERDSKKLLLKKKTVFDQIFTSFDLGRILCGGLVLTPSLRPFGVSSRICPSGGHFSFRCVLFPPLPLLSLVLIRFLVRLRAFAPVGAIFFFVNLPTV